MISGEQVRAAAASFARVFGATFLAALPTVWASTPNHDVASWGWAGVFAFVSAAALTAINAVRTGDGRFGSGADEG